MHRHAEVAEVTIGWGGELQGTRMQMSTGPRCPCTRTRRRPRQAGDRRGWHCTARWKGKVSRQAKEKRRRPRGGGFNLAPTRNALAFSHEHTEKQTIAMLSRTNSGAERDRKTSRAACKKCCTCARDTTAKTSKRKEQAGGITLLLWVLWAHAGASEACLIDGLTIARALCDQTTNSNFLATISKRVLIH